MKCSVRVSNFVSHLILLSCILSNAKKNKKQSCDGIIDLPSVDLFSKYWHQRQPLKPTDWFEMFYSWLFCLTVSLKMPNSLVEVKKTFFAVCIKSEFYAKMILRS